MRIDRRSQCRNQIRQRIAEVAILSTSETMAFHHHVTTKDVSLLIKIANPVAFVLSLFHSHRALARWYYSQLKLDLPFGYHVTLSTLTWTTFPYDIWRSHQW